MLSFELDWLGGAAERRFRRVRPGADDLPWGTRAIDEHDPALVARARLSWTRMARNEYATAVSFARLLEAMLLAQTPVDLVGLAGGFVADELHHVELCARVAMELGGAPPVPTDFAGLGTDAAPGLSPRQRANELMMRLACVGEAFSVPMMAGTMAACTRALPREVLTAIVRDEAHHGSLGRLYLGWIAPQLDDAERARLAGVAIDALQALAPLWQGAARGGSVADEAEIRALGWMPAAMYVATARAAVEHEVVAPLAQHGIELPAGAVAALFR